ncbi:MAG: ribonuclease H family protein [Clostridia bacterium]
MAKKIYCVKNGKKAGIYNTWAECKAQVDGFSGAVYKSFTSMADAEKFMGLGQEEEKKIDENKLAVAYVDGSYKHSSREFSCGAVLFYNGEEKHFSKKYNDENLVEMRNVAGEIMGAVTVIRYCIENKIEAIEIYYDYEGVAKWAMGEWKANKKGTIAYKNFIAKSREKLLIKFVKVKGHSGDKYNDMADMLAKQALGI